MESPGECWEIPRWLCEMHTLADCSMRIMQEKNELNQKF